MACASCVCSKRDDEEEQKVRTHLYCFVIGYNCGVFRPFINLNVFLCGKEKMSHRPELKYLCISYIYYTSSHYFYADYKQGY